MKILFLGWAELPMMERQGSGYNLVASVLARALSEKGHEISYLRGGRAFTLWGGPRIKPKGSWGKIQLFDLVNSPIPSPGHMGFGIEPSPAMVALSNQAVIDLCRRQNIEVVQIHSLEGFDYSLVAALKKAKVKTMITVHDLHAHCPQVNFMRWDLKPCIDDQGGRDCDDCMAKQNFSKSRMKHIVLEKLPWLWRALRKVKKTLKVLRPSTRAQPATLENSITLDDSLKASNEQLLLRLDRPSSLLTWSGRRRQKVREALSQADWILPPSSLYRDFLVRWGLPAEKVRWLQLGLPHLDSYLARSVPPEAAEKSSKIRLAFFGSDRVLKGLPFLLRAFDHFPEPLLSCLHLHLFAGGLDLAQIPARLQDKVTIHGSYSLTDLPGFAELYDYGIVPHLWPENSPITVLEHLALGKPVICSDLGGAREFLNVPENGFLFRSGDAESLLQAVQAAAESAKLFPKFPNPSFEQFVFAHEEFLKK